MNTDVAEPADRNVTQNEAEKKMKIQELTCGDTTNVEHEVYDHTGNSWRHRNSSKTFEEKFGVHTRTTLDMIATNDSCTWNITHNTERAEV